MHARDIGGGTICDYGGPIIAETDPPSRTATETGKEVLKFHRTLANRLVLLTVGRVKFVVSRFTGGIGKANVNSDEPITSLHDICDILKDSEVYCDLIGGGNHIETS
jgi:hypothetical protein